MIRIVTQKKNKISKKLKTEEKWKGKIKETKQELSILEYCGSLETRQRILETYR